MYDRADEDVKLNISYSSERIHPDKTILLSMRKCFVGEENNTQTRTCETCKPRTYSLDPGRTWTRWPEKAHRLGGTNITPNPGF